MAIYDFLKHKINKNFYFIIKFKSKNKNFQKKKFLNIIISKSGNTLETIVKLKFIYKKKRKNFYFN